VAAQVVKRNHRFQAGGQQIGLLFGNGPLPGSLGGWQWATAALMIRQYLSDK